MRNTFLLHVLVVSATLLCVNHSSATVSITSHTVYFQTDSSALDEQAHQALSAWASGFVNCGETEIKLTGHTDAEGNSEYNQKLSAARVNAVRQQFVLLGIVPENIHSSYFGERKPVSVNNTEPGKAKNRRVEITIIHREAHSISDITFTDSALLPQHFAINTAKGATIKGKKGIEISIPADAFTDLQGNHISTGKVDVTLTEYLNVSDAFFHGITTMSDKGLLESGGMFHINATSADGRELKLKEGKELDVKIPVADPQSDMKVYFSKTDGAGQMVWQESPAAFRPVVE